MLPFFFEKWEQAQHWVRTAALQAIHGALLSKSSLEAGCRILCVDDDRSFCHFMQRLAYSLGIQLDAAYSIAQAKQAIEECPEYQAYIIDGHLPDGSGFELVAWLREKKAFSHPIGFISRIYQDAHSFRLLKDKLKVDFVLDKPIRPAEAHQLLIQLSRLDKLPAFPDIFSCGLFAELKSCYQKTISDKLERLERMILAIEKQPTAENLQALRREVHKIAGSAGSYGYMAVSELCKELELELIDQIDLVKKIPANQQWLLSLDEFFTQIKLHFQMEFPEDEQQDTSRIRQLPALYIVEEDQELLERLAQVSMDLCFEVLAETRPDKAIQTLLSADFYPQIFLLNIHYRSSVLTGHEILKAFYRKNGYLTTVIGFMAHQGEWSELSAALQNGMTFIAEKPLNIPLAFHLLDQAPFRSLPLYFKVLVIDEDLDSCEYILQVLKYAGMEVSAVQEYRHIDQQLRRMQPDLILIDINLSAEKGIRILDKLRSILQEKTLIIGMVDVPQDDVAIQRYFDAGIDEIIFKPLDRSVLQRKVSDLLKKHANEVISSAQDAPLGLARIQTLKAYLAELQDKRYPPFPKILVMFEVEGFVLLSHQVKKKVLAGISASLEDLLHKYDLAAYLGGGRFALVFQGYDPHFVQLFMRTFFRGLPERLLKPSRQHRLRINESLVLLSSGKVVEDFIQKGERLLQLAGHMPDPDFRLIMEPVFIPLKEVMIFHDKGDQPKWLKTLFTSKGFKVSFKESFDEERFFSVIPMPLLILTGSHGNLECLPFLKTWTMQHQIQIPLLLLSRWPTEENLLRLLKEVHYFETPFSLVIIIADENRAQL